MLNDLLNGLTSEQRHALYENGLPHSRLSEIRHGKRLPTFKQCVTLSEITGYDLNQLLIEVALTEATPVQKKKFSHLMKGYAEHMLLICVATFCLVVSSALAYAGSRSGTAFEAHSFNHSERSDNTQCRKQ